MGGNHLTDLRRQSQDALCVCLVREYHRGCGGRNDEQDDEDQDDINHTLLGRTTEDVEEEMVD